MSTWEEELLVILGNLQTKKECNWFNAPVEWEALGLMDYPLVIKQPMDLRTVREKIERREYVSKVDCVADIRRVWSNAMLYNSIGSKVYLAAKSCCDHFESLYTADTLDRLPTAADLANLVDICFRLSAEEMGKVLLLIERHCGKCLYRNKDTNEVEINVDLMTGSAFVETTKLLNVIAPNAVNRGAPGAQSGSFEEPPVKVKDPRGRKPKQKLEASGGEGTEQKAQKKSKKTREAGT